MEVRWSWLVALLGVSDVYELSEVHALSRLRMHASFGWWSSHSNTCWQKANCSFFHSTNSNGLLSAVWDVVKSVHFIKDSALSEWRNRTRKIVFKVIYSLWITHKSIRCNIPKVQQINSEKKICSFFFQQLTSLLSPIKLVSVSCFGVVFRRGYRQMQVCMWVFNKWQHTVPAIP